MMLSMPSHTKYRKPNPKRKSKKMPSKRKSLKKMMLPMPSHSKCMKPKRKTPKEWTPK